MTRSIAARSAKGLLLAGVAGVAISACANENSQAAAEQSAAEASEVAAADANIKDANMDAGHEGMHAPGAPAFGSRPVVAEYVDNFRLVDHTGLSHELFYHADASAVVIMTQGNGCPIVRNAVPEYRRLKEKFADAGIEFYLMNSNLQDNRDEIAAEAEEYEFGIPVLVDNNQIIGESMGVHRTAEVFVIDPNEGFKVVYHGPLDDRLTYERQKAEPEERYLDDVLTAIVAGNDITTEAPPVTSGCLINFPERANKAMHSNLSFAKDIAPILQDKCVQCHQEGGIGPWAMTDYETVKGWTPMMRQVLRTDRMPPWHADPHIGQFKNDRSLSDHQIKTLVHWIEAGAPQGEGVDPLAQLELKAPEWPLGEPDMIIDLPAQEVPATGIVDYQYPIVENPLDEVKWIKATTVKVGSRETVHHLLSGFIPEVPEDGKGYASRWVNSTGGYAVGAESQVHGENSGVELPVGGAIGFQMHYTPYGKEAVDRTQMGFYFHEETPKYINRNSVVMDASIVIEPNTERHFETAYMEFPEDAILIDAFPHAHYRGYSANVRLRYPDGTEKMILSLPRYDFNWQRTYEFVEPVEVPKGSMLISDYLYDNSANNPANPDPNIRVTWGEQSHEEMLFTNFVYRWKGETSDNRFDEYTERLEAGQAFGAMDDNKDGILEKTELRGLLGKRFEKSYDRMDWDKDGVVAMEEFRGSILFMRRRAEAEKAKKKEAAAAEIQKKASLETSSSKTEGDAGDL